VNIRPLTDMERGRVVAAGLGLARLPRDDGSFYLVAWEGDEPLGHAHLALDDPPEVQDVEVLTQHRGHGIATALMAEAEREAHARGYDRLTVTVSTGKPEVEALYRRLGYGDSDVALRPLTGTVQIRTGPLDVDDTLRTLEKQLSISANAVRRSSDTDHRRET
jgi:GNAT superfamily N-acetyltransferase